MPLFSYVASDASNNVVKGKTDLPDRSSVIEALGKQNLRPISIKELREKKTLSFDLNNLFQSSKVKHASLVSFTRQLSAMVGAGVPLLRSLTSIEKYTDDKSLKKILNDIIKDIEAGASLGDAFSKYPATFNDIYVNMVRAGESAGILDDILRRLAEQLEKSAAMRKKIRSAMTYPTVLIVIAILAFFGLMLFVVPQISTILKDLGGPDAKLPGITLFMLGLSGAITGYWFIIIPALAALALFIIWYVHTKRGRRAFHSLILKIPVIRTLVRKLAVARFARTFSALMSAGVAVLEALDITSRAVGNALFEESLVQAGVEVKNGQQLSAVIEQNPLFPSIVAQMLAVGEETGQTDTVLVKVADFYEEEVDIAVEGLSSIIEPAMIVLMGGAVGLIAASVMLPIAQLSQNIK
ncbi:type II secretion system F family protein [Candidatus Saccharibacteria bacterium TM7i]|nr:type II secretion system F family protein [Candidatus Saccharibacteria bacterium TM7i]